MNIIVLLDEDGSIVGTVRRTSDGTSEHPGAGFVPGPGQTVREVELPEEVGTSPSATDLHRAVEEVLTREGGRR